MKQSILAFLVASFSVFSVAAYADSPPSGDKDSKLAPLAFLTSSDWVARLPSRPDGKEAAIHIRFAWAENRQIIRVANRFVVDGKTAPSIDGIYFWNPQTQTIEFVWLDAEGSLSRGKVTPTGGQLVHDFEITRQDRKVDSYVARVTPRSDGSWTNEILKKENGEFEPFIQVTYLPERK